LLPAACCPLFYPSLGLRIARVYKTTTATPWRTYMNILDKCFTKESDLVTRDVAGEIIIVPIKGHVGDLEGVFTLNELGTMIWELINGQTTGRELVEAVRNEYDVGAAEAEKDVVDFLRSLEDAGLIRPAEATS
jgi:hypothetical protein